MGKDKFAGSMGAAFCNNGRSYTFLVIGDPCAHPAKLEEAFEANSGRAEGPTTCPLCVGERKIQHSSKVHGTWMLYDDLLCGFS